MKIAMQYQAAPEDAALYRVVSDEYAERLRSLVTILTPEEFLRRLPAHGAFVLKVIAPNHEMSYGGTE